MARELRAVALTVHLNVIKSLWQRCFTINMTILDTTSPSEVHEPRPPCRCGY